VRVVGAAVAAATARSLLECPIEFAKVARQTGQDWKLGQVYRSVRREPGKGEEGGSGRLEGLQSSYASHIISSSSPLPLSTPITRLSSPEASACSWAAQEA